MTLTERIIDTSGDLFFKFGIRSISMDDIAKHLGISKKTLYQGVENKDDLVIQALKCHLDEDEKVVQSMVSPSKNAIDELVEIGRFFQERLKTIHPSALYDLKKYYPFAWKLYENHKQSVVSQLIRGNIDKGIKQGLFRADINVGVIVKFYINKMDIIFDFSLFEEDGLAAAQLYVEFLKYHIYGIASTKGANHLNAILEKVNKS